jgi:hypothetical protein
MTYATYIASLRRQVGDTRRRVHVDWVGNGSDTVFQMPDDTFPVYDGAGSYIVKVNGSTQTEGSNYSLDKETGTLVFSVAPTNGHTVTIDSSAVYLTDAAWIAVINDVIRSLGKDFFKEFVDDTNFTATSGARSLDLSSDQENCIAVYGFAHRRNTNEDWVPVENYMNWRYDPDNNILYLGLGDVFITGELFRVRGLKTYVLGDSTDDDIDVQDSYLTVVEYGCVARYWRYRYKSVVELVSKQSTESSRTPLQELIMLSDRFDRLYEIEKAKLKPQKPARLIPVYKEGGGQP